MGDQYKSKLEESESEFDRWKDILNNMKKERDKTGAENDRQKNKIANLEKSIKKLEKAQKTVSKRGAKQTAAKEKQLAREAKKRDKKTEQVLKAQQKELNKIIEMERGVEKLVTKQDQRMIKIESKLQTLIRQVSTGSYSRTHSRNESRDFYAKLKKGQEDPVEELNRLVADLKGNQKAILEAISDEKQSREQLEWD